MKILNTLLFILCSCAISFAQTSTLKGKVVDDKNKPISYAIITIDDMEAPSQSDEKGEFYIENITKGKKQITISFVGYQPIVKTINITKDNEYFDFSLIQTSNELSNITVFGKSNKNVRQLQNLTRIPLSIQDQIQNISIVSDAVIEDQGALSITDAVRNVAGVTQFASYGGVYESMTMRGFRGTPVLKNGVSLDSDFRTASGIIDMQGVESIQVLKGSASLGQGIGNGLGAAGGVINVITKTPNFKNKREVGFRAGSYGQIRPTVDFEQILDEKEKLSIRFNGAYERNDGFRIHTASDKFYVNPTLAYKPDDKTTITVEFDHLENNAVPDKGTVNLGPDTENNLYKMPHNKFLGFKGDYYDSNITTYGLKVERNLNDKFSLRFSSIKAINKADQKGATISRYNGPITSIEDIGLINRGLSKSQSKDENSVVQIDFVGKDIYTGFAKHTFQVGFDFRETKVTTEKYVTLKDGKELGRGGFFDTVNVLGSIDNNDPLNASFKYNGSSIVKTPTYGFMAQDYVELGDYVTALIGLRYSRLNGVNVKDATVDRWNPIFGLIVTPIENVNLFGSYTTTTSLRQSNNKLLYGGFAGPQDTKQWEFGVKSSWFSDQLLVNVTYFDVKNSNLLAQVYQDNGEAVAGIYHKSGDLKRKGFELEITGKVTNDLEVMIGYAYLDAKYKDSPIYENGSAPMNAAKNTANGWLNYKFSQGSIKGLGIGAGIYYVGKRPVNEFNLRPDKHGSMVGNRPFDMPDYTTVNAQVSYTYKNATLRVFANNIFDKLGYTSYYRGGYINEIAPRNFAAQIVYNF